MATEGAANCKFPSSSLVPKGETGVLNYLKKYPAYNGDGVTIAIFDSGVDPKAAGLELTPNHEVKVIERFDCTGCGDTDMSKVVTADMATGTIVGLSGRKLKLTEFMKANNLAGKEYRVGQKCLSDVYPSNVRDKILANYKLKSWDEFHKRALATVQRDVDSFDCKNGNTNSSNSTLSIADKLKKENNDSSLEFLAYCEKKFADVKTTYDCVLFETAESWIAVIDLTLKGDLENALHISEYTKTHDIQSVDDYLSVSVNVHDNGGVLEVVGMCSSHGTHVASIASGNNSGNSLENGVAPGAKIMSFTIGDGRLGSMETGVGLVRAMIKIMELCNSGRKVDVINMSYGEHAHWSSSGRFGELMNDVVSKYGVVWVASAGNHGPALCTISSPPNIGQACVIGVGAFVSPDMMEAEYSLRQKLPANVYTWTSRDPCIDGSQAVTVCAPGAAIASVPEFTLAKAQLMNGTSMAAPHVAGAIGLLISGMKQKGLNYTPFSIKRALMNTATKLSYVDPFAQGAGLLNVEKAFEYLVQYAAVTENNVRFQVSVDGQHAKGIHIRDKLLKKLQEFNVTIEPVFFNDKEVPPRDKINFNMRLTLVPTESWVQCGAYLDLCYQSRTIVVSIDPTGMIPGVHSASIKAYDTNAIEKGIIFEVPITVIQPEVQFNETSNIFFSGTPIICKPNTIIRRFLLVPNNATCAIIRLISTDSGSHVGGRFFVHTMQIQPHKYCKALETQKLLPVSNDVETVHAFKCEGSSIIEICIAKYWSNFGEVSIKFSIEFHGVYINNGNVMHAANGIHRLDLNTCTAQEVVPSIALKNAILVLKPAETKISALTERDVVPMGRQIYQNIYTYNLNLAKPYELALYVPLFSNVLYESEFESQLWMVFDSNKVMVACGDAYANSNFVKLDKGEYVVRMQVRHEKKELLDKVSEATMLASIKLSNPLSPDIYGSFNVAVTAGKKLSTVKMAGRTLIPVYVAPLAAEKLTKSGIPSQTAWLDGTITYTKDELVRKCIGSTFHYIVSDGNNDKKKSNGSNSKENKPKIDEYREGMRDYQTNMIAKLDHENAEQVYLDVLAAHPNHLPAHFALIQNLDTNDIKNQMPFAFTRWLRNQINEDPEKVASLRIVLEKIADLAQRIITETDKDALLVYLGVKIDSRSDALKIKANMEKQRAVLLDAFVKRTIALSKIHLIDQNLGKTHSDVDLNELETIYAEIGKFIDYTDLKVTLFSIWHAFIKGQYGRMTKYLIKNYEDKTQKEVLEELLEVARENKWNHIVEAISKTVVTLYPTSYRLF